MISLTIRWLLPSIALAALGPVSSVLSAEPATSAASLAYPSISAEDNARIAWWLDARYGMFIHWGVASIKGVELSWARGGSKPLDITGNQAGYVEDPVYDNLYKTWNPSNFNPKEWVKIAKAGGMKYMVLTAKHHDGFCEWDSKFTDYTIMHTPFKRDVVKEFTEACHEAGMRVGLYYSPRDWHHPDYGIGDNQKYRDYMNGQLTELLSNYGTIDVIWFDSYGKGDLKTFWGIDETWKLIKRLQPQAIINNRLAILGGYNRQGPAYWGDMDTPEQTIGKMQTTRPWESCMCFVGHQWGFKPNGDMYATDKLIHAIVSCATGDGNLLMNIGPTPTGVIEQRQADRLKEAGDWLAKYGHTVYGTRGGPWRNAKWGGSTHKDQSIYLHVFDWRHTETLRLLPLKPKIVSARVLTGGSVTVRQSDKGLDLSVSTANQDPIDTVIELLLDEPVSELISGVSVRSVFEDGLYGNSLSQQATVSASSLDKGYSSDTASQLVRTTQGFSTAQEANPWIAIDLGAGKIVKGIRVVPLKESDRQLKGLLITGSRDGVTWNDIERIESPDVASEIVISKLVAGAQVPGQNLRYIKISLTNPMAKLALRQVTVYGD